MSQCVAAAWRPPIRTHGPVSTRKAAGRVVNAGERPARPAGEALDSNETETVSGVRAPLNATKTLRVLSPETLDEGDLQNPTFLPGEPEAQRVGCVL